MAATTKYKHYAKRVHRCAGMVLSILKPEEVGLGLKRHDKITTRTLAELGELVFEQILLLNSPLKLRGEDKVIAGVLIEELYRALGDV